MIGKDESKIVIGYLKNPLQALNEDYYKTIFRAQLEAKRMFEHEHLIETERLRQIHNTMRFYTPFLDINFTAPVFEFSFETKYFMFRRGDEKIIKYLGDQS